MRERIKDAAWNSGKQSPSLTCFGGIVIQVKWNLMISKLATTAQATVYRKTTLVCLYEYFKESTLVMKMPPDVFTWSAWSPRNEPSAKERIIYSALSAQDKQTPHYRNKSIHDDVYLPTILCWNHLVKGNFWINRNILKQEWKGVFRFDVVIQKFSKRLLRQFVDFTGLNFYLL